MTSIYKILLFGLVLLTISKIQGQTIKPSIQYMLNRYALSPAYTGSHGNMEIFASYLDQNQSLGNGSVVKEVNFNTSVLERSGIGLKLNSDHFGAFEKFYAELDIAHHIQFMNNSGLSFGAGLQVHHSRLNNSNFKSEGEDPVINEYAQNNTTSLNFTFGLAYFYKGFEAGIHANPILDNGLESSYPRRFIFNASYYHYFNHNFQIQHFVLIKQESGLDTDFHANVMLKYLDQFWLTPTYRSNNIFGIGGGGIILDRYLLNYHYTFSNQAETTISTSAHEITLAFLILKNSRNTNPFPSIFNIKTQEPYSKWR